MKHLDDSKPQPKGGKLGILLNMLKVKISSLFEPEEVEVTFKVEGKQTKYTYTKVSHKQVA
jgi:hypothetical protein